jgi:hypothetical protein
MQVILGRKGGGNLARSARARVGSGSQGITAGVGVLSVTRHDQVLSCRISPQAVFEVFKAYAEMLGVEISPHDLRRSFARLAYLGQAPLEQIQLSLGHASIVTTEIYLGVSQNFSDAPSDRQGCVSARSRWNNTQSRSPRQAHCHSSKSLAMTGVTIDRNLDPLREIAGYDKSAGAPGERILHG